MISTAGSIRIVLAAIASAKYCNTNWHGKSSFQ